MTLLIRTDASVPIGTGHVMRCLALAQAWQDRGGRVLFAMAEFTSPVENRLQAEGIELLRLQVRPGSDMDADQVIDRARKCEASWIVVDGYQFGGDYQHRIKNAGYKLCVIDDHGDAEVYSADVILNQNAHAHRGLYPNRSPNTELLLGLKYVLLRREFRQTRGWERKIAEQGTKVLVTVGGSDPENLTPQIVEALHLVKVKDRQAQIVIGGSNPNAVAIERATRRAPFIKVVSDVTEMSKLMAWADIAVGAAGIVSWEICAMGLPAILFAAALNQELTAEHLRDLGAARIVPKATVFRAVDLADEISRFLQSFEDRKRISQIAGQLVDGLGCHRVMTTLRPATQLQDQTLVCRPA